MPSPCAQHTNEDQVLRLEDHICKNGAPSSPHKITSVNPGTPERPPPSLSSSSGETPHPEEIIAPAPSSAKRKRPDETEDLCSVGPAQAPRKRQRPDIDEASEKPKSQSINHWVENSVWPGQRPQPSAIADQFLARKKSAPSLRRKRSDSGPITDSSTVPSDQEPRELKSKPYQSDLYHELLARLGSFMHRSALGLDDKSKKICTQLLTAEQGIPLDSLFRDDLFAATCEAVRSANEPRIIRDISPLLVPSAEKLAVYGAKELEVLIESIDEGWNNSEPLTDPRPQPDYSVGFRRSAFTKAQLDKLAPYIGDFLAGDHSHFMGTYKIYFPFFTCEAKCGAASLDIADRQNAHSSTLAVRGVVSLYRLLNREDELHRKLLAFSVSHDEKWVRIYGHYAEITGKETAYYRHEIHSFSITTLDGKEKWTAYKFTKNVYLNWMPAHLARIRSAIDELPTGPEFQPPAPPSEPRP